MLAIKNARQKKATQPPQLAFRLRSEYDGREAHGLATTGLDDDLKSRALPGRTNHGSDEGVPLRIRRKIAQNGPHPLRRCINFDFCMQMMDSHWFLCTCEPTAATIGAKSRQAFCVQP